MSYQTIAFTLPAEGARTVQIAGRYVRCLYADAAVKIGFDDASPVGAIEQGIGLAEEFDSFRVENPTAAPVTVTFGISDFVIDDARSWLAGALGTAAPATAAVSVGPAATLVAAANANRKSVEIDNNGVDTVYLGPAGVTVATGRPLRPGDTWHTDQSAAAIYAIAAAGAVELRVMELS